MFLTHVQAGDGAKAAAALADSAASNNKTLHSALASINSTAMQLGSTPDDSSDSSHSKVHNDFC
jgi:hypothetical protein